MRSRCSPPHDVEVSLVAYSKEQEHHAALVTAVAADQRAWIWRPSSSPRGTRISSAS